MSTAPKNFINEVYVTKAFQSLKLKSSSGPDGFPNLPLKYAAKELSAAFTDLFQLSISTGVLQESHICQKVIYGRLSKNASNCMQSGAPKSS